MISGCLRTLISGCLRTLSSALLLPMHLKAGLCTGTPRRIVLLPVAAEVVVPEVNPAGLGARPHAWLWPEHAVAPVHSPLCPSSCWGVVAAAKKW